MQLASPDVSWVEWLADNADADEPTKFAALRECIAATARDRASGGDVGTDWINKKLAKLGIPVLAATNTYVVEVPVSGMAVVTVYASTRAGAVQEVHNLAGTPGRRMAVSNPALLGGLTFTTGPEDVDPDAVDPDAPTTTDALLLALREALLLGHISGPKYCKEGTNDVLEEFGLGRVPDRRQFVVTRPAQVTMRTVVEAFDEQSAERVAGWRWDNDQAGYTVAETSSVGDLAVDAN